MHLEKPKTRLRVAECRVLVFYCFFFVFFLFFFFFFLSCCVFSVWGASGVFVFQGFGF